MTLPEGHCPSVSLATALVKNIFFSYSHRTENSAIPRRFKIASVYFAFTMLHFIKNVLMVHVQIPIRFSNDVRLICV